MKVHNRIQFDTPRFHPGIIPATPALRSSRANQQLNDELRIKADELEKLFAAHKLRVHGPDRLQADHAAGKRPAIEDEDYFMENQCSVYEDDRGKGRLYGTYMRKRDVKLREEWRSKRVHKEANMKAMQDSIEQTRAQMTAQFAVSSNSPESVLRARHHAESPSSSSVSAVESKEETSLEYIQMEEGDRTQELSQPVYYGRDKSHNMTVLSDSSTSVNSNELLSKGNVSVLPIKTANSGWQPRAESLQIEEEGDLRKSYEQMQFSRKKSYSTSVSHVKGSYRNMDYNKLLLSKSVSSTMTQTTVAPTPRRSTVKATNTGVTRPRMQSENFLERKTNAGLKKENTSPLNGSSKVTNQASLGNLTRSRITNSVMKDSKEDKSRRSEPVRRSYGDLSPLNSNAGKKTPGRLSKDPSEHVINNKIQKSSGSKPFLRKGNGVGPGVGAGSAKRKALSTSEMIKKEEEFEDEDIERTPASGTTLSFPTGSDSDDPMSGQESTMFGGRRPVYNDVMISPETHDDSPGSWTSHVHHSFSYAQDVSNAVASMDPPRGSSASCNSRPVKKIQEADSLQSRKTWGNARNPFSASSASQQSPKEVSKGFMRLLSFGKKSKAVDSTVSDMESASAQFEGGCDLEDRNEMANRSTMDPRMSRMGYSIPDHGAYSMVDILPGQVPSSPILRYDHRSITPKSQRSLFSLPPFRSRRGGSKLK